MKSFFTPKEVVDLIGISYRQIQYWDVTGFICPSYRRRGKYRLYTFADLIQFKLVKMLRCNECSIQKLRRIMRSVKEHLARVNHPLGEVILLIEGEKVIAFTGEFLVSGTNRFVRFDVKDLREATDLAYPGEFPMPELEAV